jgi:hypothetical protein
VAYHAITRTFIDEITHDIPSGHRARHRRLYRAPRFRLLLAPARQPPVSKVITFEFSHFMRPNSMWEPARNLYNRYREHVAHHL